jgi:hypothetical protein
MSSPCDLTRQLRHTALLTVLAGLLGCPANSGPSRHTTPTVTPTNTGTLASTPTPTASPPLTFTSTQTVTAASTRTRTATDTPTRSPSSTATPTPNNTATPTPSSTASTTPTRTHTATGTPTPSPTPTATVNHAPVLPEQPIYRAYPDNPISLPIGVTDVDGNTVRCSADSAPEGATLDATSNVFAWTPRADQLGPFSVPFTCTDDGVPPLSADGSLLISVSPPDLCAAPACDPATGCSISLPPPTEACCSGDPTVRVAEPSAGCPEGRVLFLGRNDTGFGRMQDCDTLRVVNFAQTGAIVRFNVQARCVNANLPVIVRARMETKDRLLFDLGQQLALQTGDDGFFERSFVTWPVGGPQPYFDLQDAEANLHVSITDVDNVLVERNLRLKLTFTPIADLPESDPTATPTTEPSPTP